MRQPRAPRVKPPRVAERALHKAVVQLLALGLPRDAVVHHCPLEALRGTQPLTMVAMGVQYGRPDIEINWRGRAYFFEIKRIGGTLNQNQIDAILRLRAADCPVWVISSVDEAVAALAVWGIPCAARLDGAA